MEHGERSAIEAISKLIDMGGGLFKGVCTISAKGFMSFLENKKNIVAGHNDINKLRNCGEPLNVIKINENQVDKLKADCKEFGLPMSIVKNNDEHFLFYKQSDSKLMQMVMEKNIAKDLSDVPKEENKEKVKTDVPKNKVTKEKPLLTSDKNYNKQCVKIKPKDIDKFNINKTKNVKSLQKSKELINIISLSENDMKKFDKLSKELKIPVEFSKNNKGYLMFFKQKDIRLLEIAEKRFKPKDVEKDKDTKSEVKKKEKTNPDNNIRNNVKEAEKRLHTPSSDVMLEKMKQVSKPKTKSKER